MVTNSPAVEGVNVGGPSADTSTGTLGRIWPGGQDNMAQFLPI